MFGDKYYQDHNLVENITCFSCGNFFIL